MKRLLRWVDEQTQLITLFREFMEEPLAQGVGWPQVFGSAVLFLFVLQLCTGVLLMVYYAPSPEAAYESTVYISQQAPLGGLVRSLHHWGASVMLVLLGVHMLQTFFWGAYKRPRQIIWVIGVALMAVTFGLSFTGYLLPWDQKAYWATVVGTRIAGSVPVIGSYVTELIRGGSAVGALTLTRFFALHTLIFPALLAGLIAFHVAQVRAKGITPPWRRVGEEAGVPTPQLFYPDQAFKDLVISLVLLVVLFAVARNYAAPLEPRADPTATGYVPRPEWYFLPNFQLLRYVPTAWGAWGEFVGAAVIPALVVLALLILPYFDRNRERSPLRRPLSCLAAAGVLGSMTYLGIAGVVSTPHEIPLTAQQARGEKVFLDLRCNACHGINGGGGVEGQDLAPDGPRDPQRVATILRDPTKYNPRSIMPPVTGLSNDDFVALVAYVAAIDHTFHMPLEAVAAGARRPASHQTENWLGNHKYEVYKDPTVCSDCHKPSFCQSCHRNRLPDSHLRNWLKSHFGTAEARPEYCQVCHDQAFCDSCHSRLLHTSDWMERHPRAAHTDGDLCGQCHKPDYCVTCHRGATPASHHAKNWLHEHSKAPAGDCSTCHTASFCSSCHEGARPQSHDAEWMKKHGTQAKSESSSCATCHRTTFCLDCHGGVQMPHPGDWIVSHKSQASFAQGSPCFRCHTYDDRCAQCHGPTPPT